MLNGGKEGRREEGGKRREGGEKEEGGMEGREGNGRSHLLGFVSQVVFVDMGGRERMC